MNPPSYSTCLAIVCNIDAFLLSHRLPLALEALQRGWRVVVMAADTGRRAELEAYGITFVHIPFSRAGLNPLHEARCVYALYKAYRYHKPDIVHHVGLKGIVSGSIAARLGGIKSVVNAVSGFGYAFTGEGRTLLCSITKMALRLSCYSSCFRYIVQNPDDALLIEHLGLSTAERITLIKGSGVCLRQFAYTSEPDEAHVRILLPSRLLYDKGVMEFLQAAHLLRERLAGKALFALAGQHDTGNPSVIPQSVLNEYLEPGYIEYIGFCKNMYEELKRSHIVVLPSYREGMPKALIEAAAVGRPLVATDAIGCRECVDDGVNGYLVPVKSVELLAEAIYKLAVSSELRQGFGLASRRKAESEFGIDQVVVKTFAVYEESRNFSRLGRE